MNIKKVLYTILINIFILSFVVGLVKAITIPSNVVYWILVYFGFAIILMLSDHLLKFLTVKKNFLTNFIVVGLLAGLALYLLSILAPGFYISNLTIKSQDFKFITVQSISLGVIGTIILASAIAGLMSAILGQLGSAEK